MQLDKLRQMGNTRLVTFNLLMKIDPELAQLWADMMYGDEDAAQV